MARKLLHQEALSKQNKSKAKKQKLNLTKQNLAQFFYGANGMQGSKSWRSITTCPEWGVEEGEAHTGSAYTLELALKHLRD